VAVTARLVVAGAALDGADDAVVAVTTALAGAGTPVTARVVVEDDDVAFEEALAAPADLTIVLVAPGTGTAFGTPAADVVRRALADVTGARLTPSEKMRAGLEQAARSRGHPVPRVAERFVLIPDAATVWTADGAEPGWLIESHGRAFVVLVPGAGLSWMIEQHLVPYARALTAGRAAVAVRTLRTAGVEPAGIEARLAEWLGSRGAGGDVEVTTLAAAGEVWVRLRAHGATASAAEESLAAIEAKVVERLGDDYFGRDGDTLERVVGRLLVQRGLMVSVAESCTGGLLGHRITNVPGSSAYFERGVMVYTNRAKQELLGVPEDVLRAHGAVSGQCAEAMVRGVCRLGGSACGLAVTGIAGPDGGTPTKPVGTVWIGVAVSGRVAAHHFLFDGDRAAVKWQSAQAALELLRRALLASR
jgi:nicotinamide-nucleotide amidase